MKCWSFTCRMEVERGIFMVDAFLFRRHLDSLCGYIFLSHSAVSCIQCLSCRVVIEWGVFMVYVFSRAFLVSLMRCYFASYTTRMSRIRKAPTRQLCSQILSVSNEMLFRQLYDSCESHHLTGPTLFTCLMRCSKKLCASLYSTQSYLFHLLNQSHNWTTVGGGGTPYMKGVGMLVVSLRGVNFGFWSRLGCPWQNTIIFSRKGLF